MTDVLFCKYLLNSSLCFVLQHLLKNCLATIHIRGGAIRKFHFTVIVAKIIAIHNNHRKNLKERKKERKKVEKNEVCIEKTLKNWGKKKE